MLDWRDIIGLINISKKNMNKKLTIILISAAILLLIGNGVTAYFYFTKKPEKIVVIKKEENNDAEKIATTTETVKEEEVVDMVSEEGVFDNLDLFVEWQTPEKISAIDFFNKENIEKQIEDYKKEKQYYYGPNNFSEFAKNYEVIKIGKTSVDSKERDLFLIEAPVDGPSLRKNHYLVIKNGTFFVLVSENSDSPWGLDEKFFIPSKNLRISNLDFVESIKIPDSKSTLKYASDSDMLVGDIEESKKVFVDSDGREVFKPSKNGCFYAAGTDGLYRVYKMDLNSMGLLEGRRLVDYNTVEEEAEKPEYITDIVGCGIGMCNKYVDYINQTKIKLFAQTSKGNNIYEIPLDIVLANEEIKKDFQSLYDLIFLPNQEKKQSFEEFVEIRPFLYIEDPLGGFIQIRRADLQPYAECGKPVIYLYPEQEQDVSVWVQPTGGFTVTEPVYNNGWRVKADPESNLYNYADKQVYPYLFWEGYGLDYSLPAKGFLVKKENVKTFLEEKLAKLGLIKKEYDEFIDFWLPKMQAKPYYYVAFTPQTDFDKLAPLTVEPKPDTVIRVFMDYQELDYPVAVEEPEIITPERKGFTVVEWGGALHK